MNCAVVNCSSPFYNLGAEKIYAWLQSQGHSVTYWEGNPGPMMLADRDQVYLSVIFSWDAILAKNIALDCKGQVEAGGPGLYALANWWQKETGFEANRGLDPRFDHHPGNYRAVFASRGCPVNCWFCLAAKIEGTTQVLDWNFEPAPMLYDNNLSALPLEFQRHIVQRYVEEGVELQDANSGFEPSRFTDEVYSIWKDLFGLGCTWRWAFDESKEEEAAHNMANILKKVSQRRKRVYVLAGNEPVEACYERAQKVLEWDCTPYVQPVMPLNALSKNDLLVRYDWTFEKLKAFQQYYNGFRWWSVPITEYVSSTGKHFADLQKSTPYLMRVGYKRGPRQLAPLMLW